MTIPPELRLQIYSHLPELGENNHETVTAYSRLTPSISRTSQQLRRETLPLFAAGAHFVIQMDEASPIWNHRVRDWIAALGGDKGIQRVRSLQFSRHWRLSQPTRWQGHVGFYLRLERPSLHSEWTCSTGTYPVARDLRGMRVDCTGILQLAVAKWLSFTVQRSSSTGTKTDLVLGDVEFVVEAMDIVASRPIDVGYSIIEHGVDLRQKLDSMLKRGDIGRSEWGKDSVRGN